MIIFGAFTGIFIIALFVNKHRPLHVNQLLCRVQLLAELFHLLVVAETLFVVLVQLQTLSDVTAQQERK